MQFFAEGKWTKPEILDALTAVKRDLPPKFYGYMPSVHDWTARRPKNANRPEFLDEPPDKTIARIADNATGWGEECMRLTVWGLRNRDAEGRRRLPEAYDKLVESAIKFDRPECEVEGFRNAKITVETIREARVQ